jgi:hypothetical protein
MGAGVLLDDLLVAEDFSAAEITSATLHTASSESSSLAASPQEARNSSNLSRADGASDHDFSFKC